MSDILTAAEGQDTLGLTNPTARETSLLAAAITAVSTKLDELVGPIVERAVTEYHDGGRPTIMLDHWPVTSFTSVTEYDTSGTSTTLTLETESTKPADGFLPSRSSTTPSLYGWQLTRRSSGHTARFAAGQQNVVVVTSAGRYAAVANVPQLYKQCAREMLRNAWRAVDTSVGQFDEFDVPVANFPTFAVPNVVREWLSHEWQGDGTLVA